MARRFRRRIVIVVLACAFAFTWLGWIVHDLGSRGDREQQRADQASQAATQACDQLLQLGYPCPFDPAQFRGETGATGPAGRAPTEAEIAAAVSVYLAGHPAAPGPAPTQAEIAAAVTVYLLANPAPAGEQGPAPTRGADPRRRADISAGESASRMPGRLPHRGVPAENRPAHLPGVRQGNTTTAEELTMSIPVPTPEEAKQTEPALKTAVVASVSTLVVSFIGLLVAFGVGITKEQGAAILAAVVALLAAAPLVSGWFTRQRVWAPATVAKALAEQRAALKSGRA